MIALGGAWLTNRDPSSTRRTLDLLAAAADAGLPTAVLAGTVGLLADPQLRRRTENILARVGPIALREPLVGARNLAELGVPSDRMVVTGDAALDLARDEPPIPMGRGIGVCAGLAEVANGEEFIGTIRRALHDSAASRGAPIVEMAVNQGDDDEYRATRRLTLGYPQVVREEWSSRSPAAILRRVAGCRIVVTANDFVGALALSRGIPVVLLTVSDGDTEAGLGMRSLFADEGVEVVSAAGSDPGRALELAVHRAWEAAPRCRARLLDRVGHQVAHQREFWRRALEAVPDARVTAAAAPLVEGDEPDPALALSVVVPCWNRAAVLPDAIEALAAQRWNREWEIVVADNGSTDDTHAVLAALTAKVERLRIVDASDRRGAAHARNVGARAARGRSIAFFDSDDVPHDGWVAGMGEALEHDTFVACRLETDSLNDDWAAAVRGRPQSEGLLPTRQFPYLPAASGGTIGIRRAVFLEVGGFDESLPLAGEDLEFSWRVQLAGHPLKFVPDAVVSMRYRNELRDLFGQARRYGFGQPAVYERYRLVCAPETLSVPDAGDVAGGKLGPLLRLAGGLLSRAGRARIVWQAGWHVGVVQGRIRRRLDGLRG